MKLRHPAVIRAAAAGGAVALRAWMSTVGRVYKPLGPPLEPRHLRGGRLRVIYAFWHEVIAVAAARYAGCGVKVLISTHADGELIAQAAQRLGYGTVRGSSTRGGATAVRRILAGSGSGHFCVTPDGPRGPRRKFQGGAVWLASRTGLPIVPVCFGFSDAWRANSWDRFAVPKPFSRAVMVSREPIYVAPDADRDELEAERVRVEAEMLELTALAEQYAGSSP